MSTPETARPAASARLDVAAPWISTVVRLVVGVVLIVAGALKVLDPGASVQAVRAYELLPEGAARLVGYGLPFAEIMVGLLLVIGLFTRVTAIVAGAMFVVFIAAVGSAAARGLSIDCGCFGGGGQVAEGQTRYAAEIVRDVGLALMCGWLAWRPASRFALDHLDPDDGRSDLEEQQA